MTLKQVISEYKTVNEFLGDLHLAVKDTPWPKAITQALPWAGIIGEVVADSVAPIKFILSIYDKLTQIRDPNLVAELVCTLAFQRSLQQSLTVNAINFPKIASRKSLELPVMNADFDLTQQMFRDAMQEFLESSLVLLRDFLTSSNFEEADRNRIGKEVRNRFQNNVSLILASGETHEKFLPIFNLLQIEDQSSRTLRALDTHAAYQQWLYEEQKILQEEPFALKHIYVPHDCGKLT